MNPETIQEACNRVGIAYRDVFADGRWHQTDADGKRPQNGNGRIMLFTDGTGGMVMNWCQMDKPELFWFDSGVKLSPTELQEREHRVENERVKAEQELAEERAACRMESAEIWFQGKDANPDHPYLLAKKIQPYGIREYKANILVPVQDSAGTLHGLQFICPNGTKRFKSGTSVAGCYHAIGKPDGKLLIAEGYATAATLHEVTGFAVACAFNAGNLKPVAEALRANLTDTVLIICADDDYATEGNPGRTKATEAAQAVHGLLAVPDFPDTRGAKDTDFNDLEKLAGADAVRTCIEGAKPVDPILLPTLSDTDMLTDAVDRLAKLSLLEYDRVRKEESQRLGVRPGALDAAVKAARRAEEKTESTFHEVDPWPEPVDGAELLADLVTTIRRFIICEQHTAVSAALWVVMSWFMDVVSVAPLALITAPEKRCGKTMFLSLIGKLVPRPLTSSSITPSALFRSIDLWKPTLLIDETDACLKDNEELRGLINSGHTRDSAYTIRCVGDDHTPTRFNTWGAKALSGIGHVADTLMDRSIILELRRKLPNEEVERIRHAEPDLFNKLSSKLARFAEDNSEAVQLARPPLPKSLNDRAQDNWEPLLAIAMVAGGDWLTIGTAAAAKMAGDENTSPTIGTELLADVQEIFQQNRLERISTTDLIKLLVSDDEKPWAGYNRGFQVKPRQIATMLKGYGIRSKTIRIGTGTAKGFEKDQFKEAFSRYIPTPPPQSVTESQTAPVAGLRDISISNKGGPVTDEKPCNTLLSLGCYLVTDENPLAGEDNIFDLSETDLQAVEVL